MIFRTPQVNPDPLSVLDQLRDAISTKAGVGGPVVRRLRRQARTSAYSASTSIEGFEIPTNAEAVANLEALGHDSDSQALSGYALAMQHVQVLANDPCFRWIDRVLLDLHFEACSFQRDRDPGLWRMGPIQVTRPGGGAYRAPESETVVSLVSELLTWLEQGDRDAHPAVRGAMAHLHLVSIHPFRDGNGRVARILQGLVLARSGPLPPELGSIETYLARHTADYYAALTQVQGQAYDPSRDASRWVEFCIQAHLLEAQSRLQQLDAAARRWQTLEELVMSRGWPDRLVIALEQAVFGSCVRADYAAEAGVSLPTASSDLRRLRDAGWVKAEGRGRSVRYLASETLRAQLV